jgi:signal transduction histidine kinase
MVKDSGPGVAPELLQRLGDPWVKGPQEHLHGLGLAIVKGIMRLHRGSVAFASPPGSGLEVCLIFPEPGS